ncbi:MAG: hypothetical protein JXR95_09555 [Deltaproteobacteria bacterium]|nr:hypothetical protein [Deltaproteobacteria bacterium]
MIPYEDLVDALDMANGKVVQYSTAQAIPVTDEVAAVESYEIAEEQSSFQSTSEMAPPDSDPWSDDDNLFGEELPPQAMPVETGFEVMNEESLPPVNQSEDLLSDGFGEEGFDLIDQEELPVAVDSGYVVSEENELDMDALNTLPPEETEDVLGLSEDLDVPQHRAMEDENQALDSLGFSVEEGVLPPQDGSIENSGDVVPKGTVLGMPAPQIDPSQWPGASSGEYPPPPPPPTDVQG